MEEDTSDRTTSQMNAHCSARFRWATGGWCSDGAGRRMKIYCCLDGVGSPIRGCCYSPELLKTKICRLNSMDAAVENQMGYWNGNKVLPDLKNKLPPVIGCRIWGR
ncbi:hypothetical protein ACLOJK_009532 [Asimina triloba]